MPVSKKRKTVKKTGRKFGVTKRIPNVQSLLFKYIHAYFDESISEYVVYVNLVCNDVPVIMSGFIDPDKSYFEGIRLHNPILDINNGGKYFPDKLIEDYRVLK
jgi:hypothetical protein